MGQQGLRDRFGRRQHGQDQQLQGRLRLQRHRDQEPARGPGVLPGHRRADVEADVANAPKDSSGNTLVLSNTHKNCAANIANMLAFNTAAIVKTNAGAVPSKAVKGDKPNAISFPTWSVAIGDKPLAADFNYYVVPNGFCYVNQCLESYLTSATSDKGAGYGKLVSSPNMGKPG